MMIYDFYNAEFSRTLYMIFKLNKIETYYIKRFLKQYYSEIIINEDEYFKYH